MSVYTIRTTPVQIYDGAQGAVSVKNQGASTVYLDSQSSVNPDNGWSVAPGSVVRWDRNAPLWAVTRYNECRLNVNPVGLVSDEVVTSVQRLLYQYANPVEASSFQTETFECAQYETLLLRGFSLTATNLHIQLVFSWYDEAQNFLSLEPVTFTRFDPGVFSVNIPARGSFCQITVNDVPYGGVPHVFSLDSVKVYGSTRTYGLTAENATVWENVGPSAGFAIASWGNLYVETAGDASVLLPQWGSVIDIACSSGLVGGTVTLVDQIAPTIEYARFTTPNTGLSAGGAYLVPRARPVFLRFQGYAATTIYASLNWRDYA